MYKIVWKSKTTGFCGEGEPDEDRDMLLRVAAEMDYTFPDLTHEVVEVKADPQQDKPV
jgi:hypothetical protein